jgi:hypothetical protein
MAICATGGCPAVSTPAPAIRVLRWTFRRDTDTVVCELGLNSDDSAYELRVSPPSHAATVTPELFDDVASAFDRHAAIEKQLVSDGWLLEAFHSEHVAR